MLDERTASPADDKITYIAGVFHTWVYIGTCPDGQPYLPGTKSGDLTHVRVFMLGERTADYELAHSLCRPEAVRKTVGDMERMLFAGAELSLDGYAFFDKEEALECLGHLTQCAERAEAAAEAWAIRELFHPTDDPWADVA